MTKMDDVGKRTYYTGSSAVESGDSVKYFHYNHRGDTVLVTDLEGNVLNNFSYEAYGIPTNSEGIPFNSLSIKDLPNLFVGASGIRYDTKTNLHYMRFRWFSGEQMRFISADLLMDLNRYAYVSGNPVRFIDPMGLWMVRVSGGRVYAIPTKYGDTYRYLIEKGYMPNEISSISFGLFNAAYDITDGLPELIVRALKEQEERDNSSTGSAIDKSYVCAELVFAVYHILGYRPSNTKGKLIDSGNNFNKYGKDHPLWNMANFAANPKKDNFEKVSRYDARKGTIVLFGDKEESPAHAAYHTGLDDIVISKFAVYQVDIGYAETEYYLKRYSYNWYWRAAADLIDVPQNNNSIWKKMKQIDKLAEDTYRQSKGSFKFAPATYYNKCKNPKKK